jgi:hypothetical protein
MNMGFRDQVKQNTAAAATKPNPAAAVSTKPAPAAAPAGARPRGTPTMAAQGKGYSGLRPAEGRSPFLESGDHGVEFVETKEIRTKAKKPWLKTEVLIRESDTVKPGLKRTIRKVISDEAFEMSGPEILSMMVAAFGYDGSDEEQFAAFTEKYPDWPTMLNAVHGVPEACAIYGNNPLAGMTARVQGYDTEPTEDGKVFVNCNWSPWSPE